MIKRKIIFDSILSISATTIPILLLQLIILPTIALELGDIKYGLIITLISMSNLFSLPFGNVLNNIRLLLNEKYAENKLNGDFNILLLSGMMINTIVIIIGTIYYMGFFSFFDILLIVIFSLLNLIREYIIVSFRILINYKYILINNLIMGLGYLAGLVAFKFIGYWQLIYLFGAFFSLFFVSKKSNLLKEGFKVTKFFYNTTYKVIILYISSFVKSVLKYADKLLIFPLLGPSAVATYYSATLIGKIISMGITPLSGVMLSYLAKMKDFKIKIFIKILLAISLIGFIGYFLVLFISAPILKLLYPNWAEESLKLVHITAATSMVGLINVVIHPIILKFSHINWQLFINLINLLTYTVMVYLFFNLYGLIGFCLGILISSIIKLALMISIFIYNYRKKLKIKL